MIEFKRYRAQRSLLAVVSVVCNVRRCSAAQVSG